MHFPTSPNLCLNSLLFSTPPPPIPCSTFIIPCLSHQRHHPFQHSSHSTAANSTIPDTRIMERNYLTCTLTTPRNRHAAFIPSTSYFIIQSSYAQIDTFPSVSFPLCPTHYLLSSRFLHCTTYPPVFRSNYFINCIFIHSVIHSLLFASNILLLVSCCFITHSHKHTHSTHHTHTHNIITTKFITVLSSVGLEHRLRRTKYSHLSPLASDRHSADEGRLAQQASLLAGCFPLAQVCFKVWPRSVSQLDAYNAYSDPTLSANIRQSTGPTN